MRDERREMRDEREEKIDLERREEQLP